MNFPSTRMLVVFFITSFICTFVLPVYALNSAVNSTSANVPNVPKNASQQFASSDSSVDTLSEISTNHHAPKVLDSAQFIHSAREMSENLQWQKLQLFEDRLNALDLQKFPSLRARIDSLVQIQMKFNTHQNSQVHTFPRLQLKDTRGFAIYTGSASGNFILGFENQFTRKSLKHLPSPKINTFYVSLSSGMDFWTNLSPEDNGKWALNPFLKGSLASPIYRDFFRAHTFLEPFFCFGHTSAEQDNPEIQLGWRAGFGLEFYFAPSMSFVLDIGATKSESLDGSSTDLGINPLLKAGPKLWFR